MHLAWKRLLKINVHVYTHKHTPKSRVKMENTFSPQLSSILNLFPQQITRLKAIMFHCKKDNKHTCWKEWLLWVRISQPWHYWHLGMDNFLLWGGGAFLDIVRCLVDSQVSTPTPSHHNQMFLQTFCPEGQNHPGLKTTLWGWSRLCPMAMRLQEPLPGFFPPNFSSCGIYKKWHF